MALVVRAGCRVRARVDIQNIGQQTGTFRLRGQILYGSGDLEGVVGGNFFDNANIHTENNLPQDNDFFIDTIIQGGQTQTVTMYTANWAGSNPAAFSSGQQFDTVFTVEVLETGEVFEFEDTNALQHQQVSPANAVITGVSYDLITCP